ncbi:MAG: signal peptide peptidase SppA [Treponema sp.]|nr:signal peptide peptidase SppA [Treponema sp.]
MKSSKKGLVIVIALVSLVVLVLVASGFVAVVDKVSSKTVEEKIEQKPVQKSRKNRKNTNDVFKFVFGNSEKLPEFDIIEHPYFAVLHVEGVIMKNGDTYNQEWIMDTIENLVNDSKNLGILLYVDSPGGTVYESDETYLALLDYKEATGRPVFAYFASLAASGGYYIASAADKIYANRNTLTGSIGVIAGESLDATELLDKIGIKSRTFTAGRNKNMLNYNQPLTEEQAQIMQSIADDAYEQFTSIVAEGRHMPIERVKKLADGRIYTASQALKNGLIDDICSFEEAKENVEYEMMKDEDYDSSECLEFEDFSYKYESNFMDLFGSIHSLVKNPKAEFKLNYLAY